MNRRRRIERKFCLGQLIGARRNRRVRIVCSKASASVQPGGPDWRALGRRLARASRIAAKAVLVLICMGGVVAAGYYSHRYLSASPYFMVHQIEVKGVTQAPFAELQQIVDQQRGRNIFTIDTAAFADALRQHPWIKEATVRRRMPNKLSVEIQERTAEAVLLLGHLYLVAADGELFKQATPSEADGRAVITGLSRDAYLSNPDAARAQIRGALNVLRRYQQVEGRPVLSEVHLGQGGEVTLYLRKGGVALRLPLEVDDLRLARLDAVWAALGPQTSRVKTIYLDNAVRPERLTVRMSSYQ